MNFEKKSMISSGKVCIRAMACNSARDYVLGHLLGSRTKTQYAQTLTVTACNDDLQQCTRLRSEPVALRTFLLNLRTAVTCRAACVFPGNLPQEDEGSKRLVDTLVSVKFQSKTDGSARIVNLNIGKILQRANEFATANFINNPWKAQRFSAK